MASAAHESNGVSNPDTSAAQAPPTGPERKLWGGRPSVDPNSRVFHETLLDLERPGGLKALRDSLFKAYRDPTLTDHRLWMVTYMTPRPQMAEPGDKGGITLLHSLLVMIVQHCPVHARLLGKNGKKKPPISFEQMMEIAKSLPPLGDVEEKGVNGVYMLLDERKQEVQLGQSGDLAAIAEEIAQTRYHDCHQRILMRFPEPVLFSLRASIKILLDTVVKMKRPAKLVATHQPTWKQKDDEKERALIKDHHITIAFACMHDAHWKAARGLGPAVPSLSAVEEDKITFPLEILDPLFRHCAELQGDRRRVLSLFAAIFGPDCPPIHRGRVETMNKICPWDPRGAE